MKKIIHYLAFMFVIVMVMAGMPVQKVQAQVLSEDFEEGTCPPTGWSTIHVSGNYSWMSTNEYHHSGSYGVYMRWDESGHENYLVTPQFTPGADEYFSFWVTAQHYAGTTVTVELSTTNATAEAFTTVLATYTTGAAGNIGVTDIGTWVEKNISLAAYAGQNIYIAFHVVDNDGTSVIIDDVTVQSIACVTPADVTASEITANSAKITWISDADEWKVQYRKAGAAEWTETTANGSPLKVLNGLDASIQYEVRVQTVCAGEELSNWSATASFATACGVVSIPFEQNFDACASTDLPACWHGIYEDGGTPMVAIGYPQYAHSGKNLLYFNSNYSGTPADQYAILPQMANVSGLRIRFYARKLNSPYEAITMTVGVMTDPEDAATFEEVATETVTSDEYQYYSIPFDTYMGSGQYIAIKVNAATTDYVNLTVDDIVVDEIPSCWEPGAPEAVLTPGNGTIATLNWTAGGTESAWVVQYATDEAFTSPVSKNVTAATASLTGLTAETTYYARVKADCGAGDLSGWSEAVAFTPTASYLLTVNDGAETNGYVPVYGYYADNITKSQFVIPASALSSIQWAEIQKLTFYSYNASINWGAAKFEVYMTEAGGTTLSELADYASMTKVMNAGTLTVSGNKMEVLLDAPYQYTGENLLIGFLQTVSGSFVASNWYGIAATGASIGGYSTTVSQQNFLPKMTIVYVPGEAVACPHPKALAAEDITHSSASLSWTAGGSETQWQYVCVPAGETPDWNEAVLVNAPSAAVTELAEKTTYDCYVRAYCSAEDQSDARKVSFTTATAPKALPFTEAFGENLPTGWSLYTGLMSAVLGGEASLASISNVWYFGPKNGFSDEHAYLNIYGTARKHWLVTPEVAMQPGAELTFDLALTAYSGNAPTAPETDGEDDKFAVLISTNYGVTWTLLRQWDNAGSAYVYNNIACSAAGEAVTIDLGAYGSGTAMIAFYGESTVSNADNNIHIDNVRIGSAVTCPKPKELAAVLTPGNGTIATLNWTAGGTESEWVVQYATDEAFTSPVSKNVTAATASLTGLTAETTYYARVKADCGAGDLSDWSKVVAFTPTASYLLTVNDGAQTNGYVPVYGYYVDKIAKSQFVIPASALSSIQWAEIQKLTFYSSNASINWGDAKFEVYMTEVGGTTLSELADYASMTKVMNAGTLTVSGNKMEVVLDAPYQYTGDNLLIGFLQTVSGSYATSNWYGIAATGASIGGYSTTVSQQDFLPKMTIVYVPGEAVACPNPKALAAGNITISSASLSWDAGGSETKWQYVCVPTGETPDWNEAVLVNAPAAALTELAEKTTYDFYVRAYCSAGEQSEARKVSFTTPVAPKALPFTEAFGTNSPTDWNTCYGLLSEVLSGEVSLLYSNAWSFGTSNGVFDDHAYIDIYGTNRYHWMLTPEVVMQPNVRLTFDMALTAYSGNPPVAPETTGEDDKFVVLVSTNRGSTWTILRQWDNAGSEHVYNDIAATAEGEEVTIDLSAYSSGTAMIAFYGESTVKNANNSIHIDNVRIGKAITCPKPKELAAVLTPGNGTIATLNWTAGGTESEWVVQYATDEAFTSPVSKNVTAATASLTGLTAETTYYARVKADCGAGDLSDWSKVVAFTPTASYLLTVNDGAQTNGYVPVYGYYVDKITKSQFVIPASALESMQWAEIQKLTFYSFNASIINWGAAKFEVYMTEVGGTTLSELADYASMTKVMNAGTLTVSGNKMEVVLDAPYQYKDDNLLIGFLQTVSGSYATSNWYGIAATGASIGGTSTTVSQQNFLPKMTIQYLPGEVPACTKPKNIAVSEITANSAKITWTSDADEWKVQYRKDGAAEWTETSASGSPLKVLNGLDEASQYEVRVQAVCAGEEHSNWSATASFETECGIVAMPFEQNFDALASDALPKCWNGIYENAGYSPYTAIGYPDYAHSGNNFLYVYSDYSGTPVDQYVILPQMADVSNLRIGFYARKTGPNAETATVTVGVMTDPENAATFEEVAAETVTSIEYQYYEILLDTYMGSGQYIAIKVNAATTTFNVHLCMDDIVVDEIPSCLDPKNIAVSEITANSVKITWTSDADEWKVQYRKAGAAEWTETSASGSPLKVLNGLDEASQYEVRVQAICGIGDVSEFTKVLSFNTSCLPVASVSENFDGMAGVNDGGGIHLLPECWGSISENHRPTVMDYTTYNFANAHSGDNAVYFFAYSEDQYLILPPMNNINTRTISLYAAADDELDESDFYVGVMTDPENAATFEEVEHIQPTVEWTQYVISLDGYTGSGIYIAIKKPQLVSANYSIVNIDDIEVSEAVCPVPVNVAASETTGNSAKITWASGADEWKVQYRKFGAGEWTETTASGSPLKVLNGLEPISKYEVRVQAVCAGEELSDWSAEQSFTTLDGSVKLLPFTEAFGTVIPKGWSTYTGLMAEVLAGEATLAEGGSWNFGAKNGVFDKHARVNIYGTNCKYWLVTPAVIMQPGAELTFDLALTAYSGDVAAPATNGVDDKFAVLISTDEGATWTLLRQWDNAGSEHVYNDIASTASGEEVTIDLSAYNSGTVMIAFYGESTQSNADNNLHIDNVHIGVPSVCPKPANVHVTDITAHAAVLHWETDVNEVYVCVNDDELHIQAVADADSWSMILDPDTEYRIKVLANCAGDLSDWTKNVVFRTLVACPAPADLNVMLTPGNGTVAALSWAPGGSESEWIVEYDTDDEFPAPVSTSVTEPALDLNGLTPETRYYARVKADCGVSDGMSKWSEVIAFTPTNEIALIVNEGSDVNTAVPVYGAYTNNLTRTQFVIPASRLAAIQWATLDKLTFYSNTYEAGFGAAEFEVYMKEVPGTTLSELQDYMSMDQVMSAGSLSVTDNKMEVTLDAPYQYTGGNLLIGFKQTVKGDDNSVVWYGMDADGASIGGYEDGFMYEQNFLPKMKINFTPGAEPSCLRPVEPVASDVLSTSAAISWTDAQEVAHSVVYGPAAAFDLKNPATYTMMTVMSGNSAPLSNLQPGTEYRFAVKALCGMGDQSPFSTTAAFRTTMAVPFAEPFEEAESLEKWSLYSGLLDDVMGGDPISEVAYGWNFGTSNNVLSADHAYLNIYSISRYFWLASPEIEMKEDVRLSFDMALTAYSGSDPDMNGEDDKFAVLISTDKGATWTILRQWDNAGSEYVYNDIASTEEGEKAEFVLHGYDGQNAIIAFYGESTAENADNNIHIDNVSLKQLYKLTYTLDGDEYAVRWLTENESVEALDAPVEREGYTFSGWNGVPAVMPAHNVEITGAFNANSYTLTYKLDGELYKSQSVPYGTALELLAAPAEREGYTFGGWSALPATMPAHDVLVTGVFTVNNYTLTYNVDGKPYNVSSVAYGTALDAIAAPTKEGYTFSGWSEIPATMPAHDVVITGTFSINTYTVVFKNYNGATLSTQVINWGEDAEAPADPEREGYTFSGWDKTFTNVKSDLTVNAQYTINTYTVIFKNTDGTVLSSQTVNWGEAAIEPAHPAAPDGYTFGGWDKAFNSVKSDLVITATYTAKPVYTVTFLDWNGATIAAVQAVEGKAAVAPADPVREGYTFTGWDKAFGNVTANMTVNAQYSINSYNIVYKVDGNLFATDTYEFNAAVEAHALPDAREGYTFSGWSEIPAVMPAHDVVITGTFSINSYTLTYKVDGKVHQSASVVYGTALEAIAAPAKEGYTFSGWSELPETMPAHDVVITGTFSVNSYTLIYKVDGETYKSQSVAYGTALEAIAAPAAREGYTFSGWSALPATMPAHDVVITGTFDINSYTLTYKVDGETVHSELVEYGAAIAAREEPVKAGYTFSGWSEELYEMPAHDVVITGTFTINKYTVVFKNYNGATLSTQTVNWGTAALAPEVPAREGYTFTGWDKEFGNVQANLTVTAQFSVNSYDIVYKVDGKAFATDTYAFGAAVSAHALPDAREGYTFSGWSEIPATMPAHNVEVTGTFNINSYTLTYKVDGKVHQSASVVYGTELEAIAAPVKEGYTFSGWSEIPATMPAHDVVITGTFSINIYTVIFKDADGTVLKTQQVAWGEAATAPVQPVAPAGYTFSGWDKAFNSIKSDLTVTATYTANPVYTVTFLDWNGSQIASVKVEEGQAAIAPSDPVREGYTFTGWDKTFANVMANMTVNALYSINSYNIVYKVDGELFATDTYQFNAAVEAHALPESREGYTFSGWSAIPANMPAHDVEVTGVFTINTYTVVFKNYDGATLKSQAVNWNEAAVAPSVPAREGYTFAGWDKAFDHVKANLTVTAQFSINSYSIVYKVDGENYQTVAVEYGAAVELIAAPAREGYTFSGWSEAPATMPAHDVEISGTFAINTYTVVFKNYNGVTLSSQVIDWNTAAIAPEVPAREGYTFSGWDKEFVHVQGNLTVTAQFAINSYNVVYKVDGNVFATDTYTFGAKVNAHAQPESREGYTFSGWSALPATMPAHDVEINGTFSINSYRITWLVDGEEYATSMVEYNALVLLEEAPVREGYTFSGWSETPERMPAHDVVVSGTFAINKYTVVFQNYDGAVLATRTVNWGTAAVAPEVPAREGYTFTGWSEVFSNVRTNLTVIAQYSINNYMLVYKVDGETVYSASVRFNADIIARDEPVREGYTFSGWSEIPAVMPAHDVEINGTFSVNWYDLVYMVDGAEYRKLSVAYGTALEALAVPTKEGYTFSGWSEVPATMPAHNVEISGTFSINTYTVIFKDADGSVLSSQTVNWGEAALEPAHPEAPAGMHFSGWDVAFNSVKSNLVVTATYTANPVYTVTFLDWNGAQIAAVQVEEGQAAVAPADPDREGYTFAGWDKTFANVMANMTVNALYSINSYSIVYKVDGELFATDTYEFGAAVEAHALPEAREGYTFSGWSAIPANMPAHDVEINGTFAINKYTVVFKNYDGATLKSQTVNWNEAAVAPSVPAREGYSFAGWDKAFDHVKSDLAVTAQFSINSYSVVYKIGAEVFATDTYEFGSEVEAHALPEAREGYTFSGWSEIPAVMPAHDVTVNGTFTVNSYNLVYKVDGANYQTLSVAYGTELAAIAAPAAREGYTFSGWSEIPATMPAHDVVISGTFNINSYTLVYTVDGEEVYRAAVAYNAAVTARQEPEREGYTFSGWDNEPSVMPAHDVTVSGTFSVNSYSLVYKVNGTVYRTISVAYGTVLVAIDAPAAREGYTFSGWSELPETMPARNVEINGTFNVNSYTLVYMVDGDEVYTATVAYGTALTPRPEPAKEGYTFSGWSEIPATMPAHNVEISGTFSINSYRLTYMVDGVEYASAMIEYNTLISLIEEPVREGYTFSGWSAVPETMPARNITVTGTFTVITFTVTFKDYNGDVLATRTVDWGTAAAEPAVPAREGYTFSGWDMPFNSVKSNLVVTAQYTVNTYTVVFKDADGTVLSTQTVNWGEAAVEPAHPEAPAGMHFSGWDKPFNSIKTNLTVTATYTANPVYTVTFLDWNGATISAVQVEEGQTAVAPAEPVREGYTFTGWDGAFGNVTANITVNALYTINSYTLTYKVDGETVYTATVEFGAEITARPEPVREGYTFSGWDNEPSVMPARNVTVSGIFAINSYTLAYMVDGETVFSESVEYNAAVTARPEPVKTGYTFSGWDNEPSVMPAHNVTVSGTFAINSYRLTYMVDGEEYASAMVEYNAIISLIEEPVREGYTFSGWSTVPANMPARDLTVTGTFSINTYTVTFKDVDGTELGTQTVNWGEAAVAPADPSRIGFTFTGWDKPFDNVKSDLTVTAQYAVAMCNITFTADTFVVTVPVPYGTPTAMLVNQALPIGYQVMTADSVYTLVGWSPELAPFVTGDATYNAVYTVEVRRYLVTFRHEDGTVLFTDSVAYGDMPVYTGDLPFKQGYVFDGWTPEIAEVTADQTYTATFRLDEITAIDNTESQTLVEDGMIRSSEDSPVFIYSVSGQLVRTAVTDMPLTELTQGVYILVGRSAVQRIAVNVR